MEFEAILTKRGTLLIKVWYKKEQWKVHHISNPWPCLAKLIDYWNDHKDTTQLDIDSEAASIGLYFTI